LYALETTGPEKLRYAPHVSQHRRVMLLQLGEAPHPFPPELGGYKTWFENAWDGPLDLVDGRPEAGLTRLPDARDYAGVIVSGSPASLAVDETDAWMDAAAELVLRAHEVGTPLLGVCFGHQLIGHAFGGRVIKNPWGWEVGTRHVDLTDDGRKDPLFAGLPARVRVNLTHRDIICPMTRPPELRVLAGNEAAHLQAVAVGTHTWGVQFHPEISGAIMRGYIHARRPLLVDHHDCDELHASTEDCPDAGALMRNFRDQVHSA
jgi:GMP synthase (glutamine-hydrolysing)